jgi:hypothetical protein
MDLTYVDKTGWQEFIVHAVNFMTTFEYPKEVDTCILCNQQLNLSATELIKKYKNIFKSASNKLDLLTQGGMKLIKLKRN